MLPQYNVLQPIKDDDQFKDENILGTHFLVHLRGRTEQPVQDDCRFRLQGPRTH
jgi:hypothetical protein